MTRSQEKALEWLSSRGGDAAFDRHGVALAQGEAAPHTRATWNALAKLGRVEFYNPSGKGRGRMRLVKQA
jgi:hypothetical protein